MSGLTHDLSHACAVEYIVTGPRSVAGLARGQTQILGMVLATLEDEPVVCGVDRLADCLAALDGCCRLYSDSMFARAVERQRGLHLAVQYHDLRIVSLLLGENQPADFDVGATLPSSPAPLAHHRANQVLSLVYHQHMLEQLEQQGLAPLYHDIELPVADATGAMVTRGLDVYIPLLEQIAASHRGQQEIAELQLCELAGHHLNPASPADVARFLFTEAGLPVWKRNSDGIPSTSETTLCRLEHPAVGSLRAYRHCKNVADAACGILENCDPGTGRLHADLDPLGAVTGRFSCSNPNLQGLPREVLAAFVAPSGHTLIEADFSQVELRVLAHLSQDPVFLNTLRDPHGDIHLGTAAAALGIPPSAVTPEQRSRIGKKVNFAIIYGQTATGLAEALDASESDAQAFIDAFARAYPDVHFWAVEVRHAVRQHGYVATCCGRRRRLPEARSTTSAIASRALRQAVNAIVQGTAADLNKLALVRLWQTLPADWYLLLTVHDSVLISVPDAHVVTAVDWVRHTMEYLPAGFSVPLRVDVGIGKTWAECKAGH